MRALPIAAVAAIAVFAQLGNAAQRTFVSGFGSDADSCALSAPCRGFATALINTDPNGEIIVLDSAGYGPVTIDKSVSIVAPDGVYAGISVFSGDGVIVSGSGIDVVLRGLTINGQGGNRGILYTFGASLRISNCVVSHMSGTGVVIGWGGQVTIEDSLIRDNGFRGVDITLNPNVIVTRTTIERNSGTGIVFNPSSTQASLTVTASDIARNSGIGISVGPNSVLASFFVTYSTISRNGSSGIFLDSGATSSPITAMLNDNTIVQNDFGVLARSTAGAGAVTGVLTNNFISGNVNVGLRAENTGALLVLDRNTVTHNAFGIVQQVPGVIETRLSNTARENTSLNTAGGPFTIVSGN